MRELYEVGESMDLLLSSNKVIFKLIENKHQAYRVGGYVRDCLLGKAVHDIDIATSALPEQVMALFERVIPTGLKHGTITVLEGGYSFEVTTFRSESAYENHRRPVSVEFKLHLEDDLARRDFTINAMAETWDGVIIDPYDGRKDLAAKTIRAVGNAQERMMEDALRMIRAVRFASQLGFLVDSHTAEAIRQCSPYLLSISIERVREEINKILLSPSPSVGMEQLERLQLWQHIFSFPYPSSPFPKTHRLVKEAELPVRWALLLRWMGYSTAESVNTLKKFRHSNAFLAQAEQFLRMWDTYEEWVISEPTREEWVRFLLACFSSKEPILLDDILLGLTYYSLIYPLKSEKTEKWAQQVTNIYSALPVKSIRDLAIDGKDVINTIKRPPGPWIQNVLHQLLWQTANGWITNDRELLQTMLKNIGASHNEG